MYSYTQYIAKPTCRRSLKVSAAVDVPDGRHFVDGVALPGDGEMIGSFEQVRLVDWLVKVIVDYSDWTARRVHAHYWLVISTLETRFDDLSSIKRRTDKATKAMLPNDKFFFLRTSLEI